MMLYIPAEKYAALYRERNRLRNELLTAHKVIKWCTQRVRELEAELATARRDGGIFGDIFGGFKSQN